MCVSCSKHFFFARKYCLQKNIHNVEKNFYKRLLNYIDSANIISLENRRAGCFTINFTNIMSAVQHRETGNADYIHG